MPPIIRIVGRPSLFAVACSAAILCTATRPTPVRGNEHPANWLTGETLCAQLDQKVSITWSSRSGVPLRQALMHLAQSQQVAILLDRRVDPDQKIEFTSDDRTLDATLKLIAAKLSIGVGQVGSVIYFGPELTAHKIRTLAALRYEDVRRLPVDARSNFTRLRPWKWDDLAMPRDLLGQLSKQCGIQIQGTDQIPHDLWGAADLPPMNFCDRLTLVAAQFDLTFSLDPAGHSVRLEPIPSSVEISHDYALSSTIEGGPRAFAAKMSKSLAGAKVVYSAGKLTVRGSAEDQDFVRTLLAGGRAKQTTVTKGEKRYTLPVASMAVGDLIRALGHRLKLDVQVDDAAIQAAGLSLNTEVKVNVNNATEDELLHDVLDPAGLTFDRKAGGITVRPKK
ncbi:MAG TPA: hypothetical protein VHX65_14790 [Pirellulales bacterium]|jgi:hypothetical protein|nr:hypothetical protein [Pirellulales bacterium]